MLPAFLFIMMLLSIPMNTEAAAFPDGRCYENSCNASPYNLNVVNFPTGFCFTFQSKACYSNPKYDCCTKFTQSIPKIIFSTLPSCLGSVAQVTVNGVKKGGGIYFNSYATDQAELIITSLNLPASIIPYSTICVFLQAPCATTEVFCKETRSGLCKFSIYDPIVHSCCPTCPLSIGGTTIPPPTNNTNIPPPTNNTVTPPLCQNTTQPPQPRVCTQCTCIC